MIHANVFNLVTHPTKNRRFVNAILNYPAEVRVIGMVPDLEAMAANTRVGGMNARMAGSIDFPRTSCFFVDDLLLPPSAEE